MKKIIAVFGAFLLAIGVKAQTSHPARKETVQPAVNKSVTGLPPSNTLDKHKGEAPAFTKASSTVMSPTVKTTVVPVTGKKKSR
jgi:hypothetical protein